MEPVQPLPDSMMDTTTTHKILSRVNIGAGGFGVVYLCMFLFIVCHVLICFKSKLRDMMVAQKVPHTIFISLGTAQSKLAYEASNISPKHCESRSL
jgi:hypothetical protein